MDTADQIMGFVMPFLPVHLSEKQALLEIVSVKERYITFLELLMETETISIRIEMAKKVTDRVSKSNREAMLREQMKVIQEELGESEGVPAKAVTGNGSRTQEDARRCSQKGACRGKKTRDRRQAEP